MKKFILIIISFIIFTTQSVLADRIKDMASFAGVRSNQLVGYGLVIGLAKLVMVVLI
jgi:flagellar P-ring protein precursor FlgI